MTIYSAAELRPALLAGLSARRAPRKLDLSDVTEFDCAGLQLLLGAVKYAAGTGKPLRILGVSPAVREVLELCHRADLLEAVAA
jgi:anti-anti-sigma factor